MKIAAKDLAGFLAAPARQSRACAIYGADEGQVREIARSIITAIMGKTPELMNLAELSGAQLKDDFALLSDALYSYSLMGGERLVWLRDPLDGQAEEVAKLVLEGSPAAYLVVTLGDLKNTSKWRTLFEKDKQLASLPCYRDEGQSLGRIINDKFRERGIKAGAEVVPYLVNSLGNDRGVTLQEIEKIDIFLGEERSLSLEQVMDLTGDNRELTLDDLCHSVCGGQPAQLPSLLDRMYEDGTQPIGVFRILHSHFGRLRNLQILVAEGTPLEQIFTQQRIFFKQQPRLRDQLRRWPEPKIARAMDALLEAEKQVKTTPVPPELLCSQLLQRLALSAAATR
jgi:DNA polymerase-3 subunit delta